MRLALDVTDDEAPETVYRVVTVLASEAGRTTYLAETPGSRRLVTLEVAGPAAVGNLTPDVFAERVNVLRRLCHPGIAPVLEGRITPDGDYCIVCEYVAGLPLKRHCDRQQMSTGDRQHLIDAVRGALEYAHQHGVAHGRLRMDRIVVRSGEGSSRPIVTGFSLCHPAPTAADDERALAIIQDEIAS
jgi:serine/threonine protein kinase